MKQTRVVKIRVTYAQLWPTLMLSLKGCKKAMNCLNEAWRQSIKSLTVLLIYIGRCRLPGLNPYDFCDQWLDKLYDIVQNLSE